MMGEPDLFAAEYAALLTARDTHARDDVDAAGYRRVLGGLIAHYERLMRETRRLIQRSDRAERDMQQMNRTLHELARQLEHRATHDPLTGALNRGALIEHAGAVLARQPAALLVLDIDHFKRVNDDFGHPAGDAVICAVVGCLKSFVAPPAAIGRVGGEEFSIVCPAVTAEQGARLAHEIRAAVAALPHGAPIDRPVTCSIGVGWYEAGTAFDSAYGRADAALYRAKREGRNCVRVDEEAASAAVPGI